MQHAQNVARRRRYFCGDKKCDAFAQAFGDQAKIAKAVRQIVFEGERFDAVGVQKWRKRVLDRRQQE